jgi:hypothetical protein
MAFFKSVSSLELVSLREIAMGIFHQSIPEAHTSRLVELGLACRQLGNVQITRAGRALVLSVPRQFQIKN